MAHYGGSDNQYIRSHHFAPDIKKRCTYFDLEKKAGCPQLYSNHGRLRERHPRPHHQNYLLSEALSELLLLQTKSNAPNQYPFSQSFLYFSIFFNVMRTYDNHTTILLLWPTKSVRCFLIANLQKKYQKRQMTLKHVINQNMVIIPHE